MKTYPLPCMSLSEAMDRQFCLIDCITREFAGHEMMTRGDLGVGTPWNKPLTTKKAEAVIAAFFGAEDCILVRGAGSGAIRFGLHAMVRPNSEILVHKAPIYPTTKTSMEMMGVRPVEADFNREEEVIRVLSDNPGISGAVVQFTRQKLDDRYDMAHLIRLIKSCLDIPVLTDDNYAVMKVKEIGVQAGGDLSCFSSFKLLGPEGIGVIVGKKQYLEVLKQEHYSGGMQTQGHEALDVLRGMTYAPVFLALQAEVSKECLNRLQSGEIPQVKEAFLANAQSKVLLVEFDRDIAGQVLKKAEVLGAAPGPIGAESKYELVPMFYRISGTVRQWDPTLESRMIRINPMRAGADTVMRILGEAVREVMSCS